jgi:hypothetical protein
MQTGIFVLLLIRFSASHCFSRNMTESSSFEGKEKNYFLLKYHLFSNIRLLDKAGLILELFASVLRPLLTEW